MKRSGAKKVITIILAVFLLLGMIGFIFFRYFTAPVGKYPGKKQQAGYSELTELFYDGIFHNEKDDTSENSTNNSDSVKKLPDKAIPAEKPDIDSRQQKGTLSVTWLGHASELIRMGEQNILIDPVLVKKGKALQIKGTPERFSDVPVDIKNMPEIDVVCISHDHFDHLDYATIRAIDSKTGAYIVPLGVDVLLEGWGVDRSKIHVLKWWDSVDINGITCTLTPAMHYSGRFMMKRNATLWGGFYLNDGAYSVYFTGDTGYYDVFTRIYERLGEPDIMFADSGEDSPAWSHMAPDEVVRAAQDMHAKYLVPVHWGAYLYGNFPWYKPAEDIAEESAAAGVYAAFPPIGHTFDIGSITEQNTRWWEEYK